MPGWPAAGSQLDNGRTASEQFQNVGELSGAVFLLPGQRSGPGLFLQARQVKRLAVLAAVNLGFRPELAFHFVTGEVPAFQMARAQLSFGIFLVAGAHTRNSPFDLGAIA